MMATSLASNAVEALNMRGNQKTGDFFREVNALTNETESYKWENILMLLSSGLGAYSALIAQPEAQKENYRFQEKMARRAEKYNIDMFNRQAGLSQSLANTAAHAGKGSPSKPREVRL